MLPVVDLYSKNLDMCPLVVQILPISCIFLGNFGKLYVGAATSRKFWIHHWLLYPLPKKSLILSFYIIFQNKILYPCYLKSMFKELDAGVINLFKTLTRSGLMSTFNFPKTEFWIVHATRYSKYCSIFWANLPNSKGNL